MYLDSAREVKALCLKQQVRPIMARAVGVSALGVGARSVDAVDDVQLLKMDLRSKRCKRPQKERWMSVISVGL